jgi:hypothetical protein
MEGFKITKTQNDNTCQMPRLNRPEVIGMVKELPIIDAFTCAA